MSANRSIRLLIVDDHPVVRDGLSGIFAGDPDFEVVGQAANGVEAVTQARELQAGRGADGPAHAGDGRRGGDQGAARSERRLPTSSS